MKAKYDTIGTTYNLTRKADPYLTQRLLYNLNPNTKGVYLDIGCGSGNYTHELQRNGYNFIGIDPSVEMLQKARLKNPKIDWRIGTAESIDLKADSIDGITATLTIHHWNDLKKGFQQLSDILKPKGRIVIFTSTPKQMEQYWLVKYFPKMLRASILQMPSLDTVTKALKKSGINVIQTEKYFVDPGLQDLFLFSGKHDPELYFRPEVRQGISSFADLANATEVEEGLEALRLDIDNGTIDKVISSCENDLGDYLYIIGQKN